MKVLVADDNKTIRLLMNGLLSSWGYEVVLAEDGQQAWEILNGSDPPKIAILDWSMPEKTGVEICEECERSNIEVYRMLLTAKTENEDMMHALDRGAHDFQTKPVIPGVLKSRVAVGKRLMEAMQDVKRSERLAAVGSLVAGVAHHFNNLNMPILMYSSSILKSPDLDENVRKKVEKIKRAAKQAGGLTDRLMSIANDQKQDKELADLNNLVTEAIDIKSIAFKGTGVKVETHLESIPKVPVVVSDVSHVVTNLLGNACDALTARPEKRIVVTTGCENGQVYVRVRDTGCGIAAEKMEKIFSPFFTEKGEFAGRDSPLKDVKGKGIGLYASKNIASDHGGDILVESRIDNGSTFTLWLPVTEEQPAFIHNKS